MQKKKKKKYKKHQQKDYYPKTEKSSVNYRLINLQGIKTKKSKFYFSDLNLIIKTFSYCITTQFTITPIKLKGKSKIDQLPPKRIVQYLVT